MVDAYISSRFTFDQGIERLTSRDFANDPKLPKSQKPLTPADKGITQRVDRMLDLPNLSDFLKDELQPQVKDRGVLVPKTYRHMMGKVRQSLEDEAQRLGSSMGKHALREAAQLIAQEEQLLSLLDHYRSLVQRV